MGKILTLLISISFVGCSLISADYVPSIIIERQSVTENKVQVYYDQQDVPFKYKELGRVFLKNINYWADRDPGGQINKIKREAAKSGADAVIIINEMRRESSFSVIAGNAGGSSGDVFQYSGIAIVRI